MVQTNSILKIARREAASLDEELRQALIKDFPSRGPKNFVQVLRDINARIVKDVEARVQCAESGLLDENDAETFVSLPLKLFPLLHLLLEHIDRTEEQENPYGILSLFTRLIERFEADFEVVLQSQWQFSYDMCELVDKLNFISENFFHERPEPGKDHGTQTCAPPLSKRFIVLSYPTSHRNCAFMHPVQGQEIGRLFNTVSGISSKAMELISSRQPHHLLDNEKMFRFTGHDNKCEVLGRLIRTLNNWTEVIVADTFAITVFGPAYLFALNEFLTTQGSMEVSSGEVPSGALRVGNLLQIMEGLGFTRHLGEAVNAHVDEISSNIRAAQTRKQETSAKASDYGALERCLSMGGDGIGREIFSMVRKETEGFACEPKRLSDEVPGLIRLIEGLVPPIELFDLERRDSRPANMISVINAGWIVYLTKLDRLYTEFSAETETERTQVFDILNRLLLKAMEVNEICEKLSTSRERPTPSLEILKYMYTDESDLRNRLFITPLLRPAQQLGNLSVDLRLGNEFIVPMKTRYPVLDPSKYGRYRVAEVEEYQEKIYKRYGEPFVLHPGQFVLGCTLEFIRLPNCFSAYIIGRSSWGRLGLTIATAIAIDPGYSGVLTLELLNSGETPIVLYPGARIAQLILHKQTASALEYSRKKLSKYKFPTSVEFSKIRGDVDWDDLQEMTGGNTNQ